jgi:hypothetical protein
LLRFAYRDKKVVSVFVRFVRRFNQDGEKRYILHPEV